MDSPAEFRKRAQECLGLIPKMSPQSRPILLAIAEAWVALAHDLENGSETKEDLGNQHPRDNIH
jgi:hypothetical protein